LFCLTALVNTYNKTIYYAFSPENTTSQVLTRTLTNVGPEYNVIAFPDNFNTSSNFLKDIKSGKLDPNDALIILGSSSGLSTDNKTQ
jgi:hypothetical protein